MERPSHPPEWSVRPERSNLSDYSLESHSTLVASPYSPPHYRSGYQPIAGVPEEDTSYRGAEASPPSKNIGATFRERAEGHGLGIENLQTQRRTSLPRVPVGRKSPGSAAWADPVLSPSSTRVGNESSRETGKPFDYDPGDLGHSRSAASLFEPFNADLEEERLNKKGAFATVKSYDPPGTLPVPKAFLVYGQCW